MMDFDLMDLEELRALQANIERAIDDYGGKRKREAITALHEVARAHGFRLKDLTGKTLRSTRRFVQQAAE